MTTLFAALSRFLRRWFRPNQPANSRISDRSTRNGQKRVSPQKDAPPSPSMGSPDRRRLGYQATCNMPKPRMHAGQFGSRLRRIDSGFSYEKYGFTKLIYLLEAVPDLVELEKVNHPNAAPAYYVRSVLNVQLLLLKVLENFDSEDGWVHQDSILSEITTRMPAFSVHTCGFDSAESFLAFHTHLLEFNPVEDRYVRLRQPSAVSNQSNASQKRLAQKRPQGGISHRIRPKNPRPIHKTIDNSVSRTTINTTAESDSSVSPLLNNSGSSSSSSRNSRRSSVVHLSRFAGFSPQVLNQKVSELAAIALPERWYFGSQPPDDFAYPILKSYLRYTFIRLQHEHKVIASANQQYRAFNTGLLDQLLRPIYALFSSTETLSLELTFCIPGEGIAGKALTANFTTLPTAANYLKDPANIFYHLAAGIPEVDWHHIIKDNMERLPPAFLAQYAPANFTHRNTNTLVGSEFHTYKRAFSAALDADPASYRSIVNRLKEALSRTLLKTQLNYKTAVPTYYPNINSIDLLLPICLVEEDIADCAIVVRRADSGKYIGHTILTLRQAYNNARLICKLDEHWLARSMILSQSVFEQEENDSEEFEADDEGATENEGATTN